MFDVVFTLDVGTGTQDFLLYIEENIKNCPKAVFPSPTKILAKEIERLREDVYLRGYTMGGGPIKRAVINHIRKGYKVYAETRSALTFSDNLEKVKEMGIIIGKPDKKCKEVITMDVNIEFYKTILSSIGLNLPEIFAIAVQDHGYSPNESNRVFRFKTFRKMLSKNPFLDSLLFHHSEIPKEFNRMQDAARCILDNIQAEVYVVDTVFAAIAGCALLSELPALLINFGNSHVTMAVVNKDYEVLSLLEHHTKVIRKKGQEYIEDLVKRFLKGEVTNEEILQDSGHGCFIRETVDVSRILCTGPNTHLANYDEVRGDPMIVGNLGMLQLMSKRGVIDFKL